MRKRIEKIRKIDNLSHRKVTYCKRKKGLLKKAIELSLLCDLKMFVFIYDKNQRRVIHYASDPSQDLMEIFNTENQREYYSNRDYQRVGGRKNDIDGLSVDDAASDDEHNEHANGIQAIEDDSQNIMEILTDSNTNMDEIITKKPLYKAPWTFSDKGCCSCLFDDIL